jgi:hypothetical protein
MKPIRLPTQLARGCTLDVVLLLLDPHRTTNYLADFGIRHPRLDTHTGERPTGRHNVNRLREFHRTTISARA